MEIERLDDKPDFMFRLLAVVFIVFFIGSAWAQSLDDLNDGAYLVRSAGCADCHTVHSDQPMAGGYRLETPFGAFYTPNITPDARTGIGTWSEENFKNALRYGRMPDGGYLYPSFPYRSFTKMSDVDIAKMYFYLRTLPAVDHLNRPNELGFPFDQRWLMFFWQHLFFPGPHIIGAGNIRAYRAPDIDTNIKIGVGPFHPDPKRSDLWNRGAYLTEAVLHCAECHTPRNMFGAPKLSLWMAGSDMPLNGLYAPNITPDEQTGLGSWKKEDWERFLSSGYTPDMTTPRGDMASVIQNSAGLTARDREAIVTYVMSLKPIHREVPHEK